MNHMMKQILEISKMIMMSFILVKKQKTQNFCKFLMKLIQMMLLSIRQKILCITANILRCGMRL